MSKDEYESIRLHFLILQDRMKRRDEDCADPKTMVDKGYSLAVSHMNKEIDLILGDLRVLTGD